MNSLIRFTFSTIGLFSSLLGIHYLTSSKSGFYFGLALPFLTVGSLLLLPKDKIFSWNLAMVRYSYSILILLGIILMCYGENHHWSKGLGFGLFIQCIFILAADYFESERLPARQRQ